MYWYGILNYLYWPMTVIAAYYFVKWSIKRFERKIQN